MGEGEVKEEKELLTGCDSQTTNPWRYYLSHRGDPHLHLGIQVNVHTGVHARLYRRRTSANRGRGSRNGGGAGDVRGKESGESIGDCDGCRGRLERYGCGVICFRETQNQ